MNELISLFYFCARKTRLLINAIPFHPPWGVGRPPLIFEARENNLVPVLFQLWLRIYLAR